MIVSQEKVIKLPSDLIRISIHPPGFAPLSVDLLENIVQRIVNGVHPQKIILFGSYAYGDPNADSDLDLLVIMESPNRPAERSLGVTRLLRPRPFPMDILVRTPQEINDGLAKKDSFIQEILSQGIVLYEKRQ